jgi:hypothetical protein
MDYEQFLKEEFQILQKAGKDKTNALLKEVEDYIIELEQPDLIEKRMEQILKDVRAEKKLSYTQYKELFPFLVSARKISVLKKSEDYFILL